MKVLEEELDETKVSSYLNNCSYHYSSDPKTWKYSCHIFYLLLNLLSETDLNSQENSKLLSVNQQNAILDAVQESATNSLEPCVKKQRNRTTYNTTTQSDEDYQRLTSCLRIFSRLFTITIVSSNCLLDDIKLDYMIGVLSVIAMKRTQEDVTEFLQVLSKITSTFPIDLVFKFLMMSRGFNGLSKDFQLLVHRQMMKMICSPNGFLVLCQNLLVKPEDAKVPLWQKCSMISKIIEAVVAKKSHQKFMIDEIFRTLDLSIKNTDREITGACVYVLKNLEAKNDEDLKSLIHSKILDPLNELIEPDVLLFGSIVLEARQLTELTSRLQVLFSPSTVASLPTVILKKHIKLLFSLYAIVHGSTEAEKLASVIVFFLSNRERQELQNHIQDLRLKDNETNFMIHPRIYFKNESLQIGSDQEGIADDSETFLMLLKNSNNNFLIYDVFLCLINILAKVQSSSNSFLSEYDVSEEDLPNVLHRKFFKKLAILEPLQEIIQWKSLHSQLNEKPKEILEVVKQVLIKFVESSDTVDEQLMIIFFSIFKELISKLRDGEQQKQMRQQVLKIKEKCKNPKLREQIDSMFRENDQSLPIDPSNLAFDDAMKLLHSSEVYCKAYGTDTLIKLLKNRDEQTIVNRHTVLAVALQNLRETESYAYLKIIKLLVALTYVMDTEVVDALASGYQNKELNIDERLKLGEAIVKITEDLGQLSVKFKDQLLKCFLNGSHDENNEYRASSLVNLGTICKVLSFQIHNFFQEMFQQLEIIIKGDDYLPSRRAAAMVLSQILEGLPNLMDFQDFLLPIYRLLKDILANESDDQTRLHAGVGLDHLDEMTKQFLNPELKAVKEIRILFDEKPDKINEIKFK